MSIIIGGNNISSPNITTRDYISLHSDSRSNLILLQSSLNNTNISFVNGTDTNIFNIGKINNTFNIQESESLIASFSSYSNIFYSQMHVNNNISSPNIHTHTLNTCDVIITPNIRSNTSNIYLLASNANGTLIEAHSCGFINIFGNLNIGSLAYNPEYSFMVDTNAYIGNSLHVPNITTKSIVNSCNNQQIVFDQSLPSWANSTNTLDAPTTQITGNLYVTGNIYSSLVNTQQSATIYDVLQVSSNIITPSILVKNISSLDHSTFIINHTNYSDQNIVDINLYTSNTISGTYDTIVDAFTIDSRGLINVGGILPTDALMSIQATSNNYNSTSNLLSIIGHDTVNSLFYINNNGDVGIGATNPVNRLHITQNISNTTSNKSVPLMGLYATSISCPEAGHEAGSNSNHEVISDLLAGYSNDTNVFYISANGNTSATNFITSNSVITNTLNTLYINTNNPANTIDYTTTSISNITTVYSTDIKSTYINTSDTIQTRNLNAYNIYTSNFFIPNLSICNTEGYYGVFTQQYWFTGSNIVMSSLESDRTANVSQGKLVVRTDDQTLIPNSISQNALGLHVIGNQPSAIRVTSSVQPNIELFGPNTTSYIGASPTQNMLYISHLLNANVIDNESFAQIKIYGTNSSGQTQGTLIENLLGINREGAGNIGIGVSSTNSIPQSVPSSGSILQVQGALVLQSPNNTFDPILFAYNNNGVYVGINTRNPGYTLDVNGPIHSTNNIYVGGSLGIGTQNPSHSLHVVGSGYINGDLTVTGNVSANITISTGYQPYITTLNTVSITTLTVTNAISVGTINAYVISAKNTDLLIENSSYNTYISGNTIIGQRNTINTANERLYVNGTCTVSDTLHVGCALHVKGNVSSVSDSTINTNLVQIDSPLTKINKLTGYTYSRSDITNAERETGLLAQDVQDVLPEVVNKNSNDLLSIAYGNMAGLWVEAFKELHAEIVSLKERIVFLEAAK